MKQKAVNRKVGRCNLGKMVIGRLAEDFRINQLDIGGDARLTGSGSVFDIESYEVEKLGHMCVVRMKAMLGLMKMETVILCPTHKDLPLLNMDRVSVAGKETQIVELYDTQLKPYPEQHLEAFNRIKERDSHLADYVSAERHWYDSIMYECSYHKTGRGASFQMARAAADYIRTYADQIRFAPSCDKSEKAKKVENFAETLLAEGGPAVDSVKKMFGDDTARRIILKHMYGVTI